MKTSPLDFLLAGILIFLNLLIAFLAMVPLAPLTERAFGAYHVLSDLFLFSLIYLLVSALCLRTIYLVLPIAEGGYDMDTREVRTLKVIISINEMGGTVFLPFIPIFFKPLFFKLFGARVGRQAAVAGKLVEPWLIELDEHSFVGGDSVIAAHAMTFNKVLLKRIKIGRRATVGVGSVVMPGVVVGENSVVAPGSVVKMDTIIPPNEMWGGVPAKKIKDLESTDVLS